MIWVGLGLGYVAGVASVFVWLAWYFNHGKLDR